MQQPKHLVEQLGLFKMPREMRSIDKDREERALENQLCNNAKGFFASGRARSDEDETQPVNREALAVQKKRE